MKKVLQILSIALLMLIISTGLAMSQTKTVRKAQRDTPWEHYQKTWFKQEVSNLKSAKRQARTSNKSPKSKAKRVERLQKLRNEVAELSARKGGSDE